MKGKMLFLGLTAMMAVIPVAAHHSFDGTFDRDRLVKLSGTVMEFKFGDPHTYFTLAVASADSKKQLWHVETTSAQGLAVHGWTPQSLKVGEALVIEGWPARDGKLYLRLSSMAHADGSAVGLWVPAGPTPRPAA